MYLDSIMGMKNILSLSFLFYLFILTHLIYFFKFYFIFKFYIIVLVLKHLFICVHWVLVVAHGGSSIFIAACGFFSWGMWDLIP